jgi:hypothetical protein
LIEDQTDAAEVTRLKYRYLDIRRNPLKEGLIMRNRVTRIVRDELASQEFVEVETPLLIKSTPEGARDFVVPSRMNPGQFYALPQSPQTFKQVLMVAGIDRYFQIAKCFRDEELRADRQPVRLFPLHMRPTLRGCGRSICCLRLLSNRVCACACEEWLVLIAAAATYGQHCATMHHRVLLVASERTSDADEIQCWLVGRQPTILAGVYPNRL